MASETLPNVGTRIKQARTSLHVQQKDAAAALGVSPSHISEVESGKSNPSAFFVYKLSLVYNISVEYIFHGRGKMIYEPDSKFSEEVYDFTSDVDTLEKLFWLAKNSPYFKVEMFRHATKFTITEEDVIKSSIKRSRTK